jgi:hypothetical protein
MHKRDYLSCLYGFLGRYRLFVIPGCQFLLFFADVLTDRAKMAMAAMLANLFIMITTLRT